MTNELKKFIKSELDGVADLKEVYYQIAKDNCLYPHVVFNFDQISALADDNNRHDYRLLVDLWDKSTSTTALDEIADSIIKQFNALNAPQKAILPTLYFESNNAIIDEDKAIKHRQLKFIVQTYER